MRAKEPLKINKEKLIRYRNEAVEMNEYLETCDCDAKPIVRDPELGFLRVHSVEIEYTHEGFNLRCFVVNHNGYWLNIIPEAWQQLYEEIKVKQLLTPQPNLKADNPTSREPE